MADIKSRADWKLRNEQGNALMITIVILLGMFAMMNRWMTQAGIAYYAAVLERQTYTTYDFAKTALEEYIRLMQQGLSAQLPYLVNQSGLNLSDSQLSEEIYTFLEVNFMDLPINYQIQDDNPEKDCWTDIQISGNPDKTYKEKLKAKHQFIIQSEAVTQIEGRSFLPDIYDRQKMEALIQIELPSSMIGENLIDIRYINLNIISLKKVKEG